MNETNTRYSPQSPYRSQNCLLASQVHGKNKKKNVSLKETALEKDKSKGIISQVMSFWYYIKRVPPEKLALDFRDEIFECHGGPCLLIIALKVTVGMFI